MSGPEPTIAISHWADRENPVKRRLIDALREWAEVVLLDPRTEHPDLVTRGFDLYHMAGWYPEALRDLRRANRAGLRTVNPYYGARATADRLACAQIRRHGGVRAPGFQYGTAEEITLDPPVVIKPRWELGEDGHEFAIVRSGDLAFDGERLVERFVVRRRSYKIYRVGDAVRSVRGIGTEASTEVAATSRIRTLTDRIAALFGLSLFEMDVVVHKNWYVIDVNPVASLREIDDGTEIYERLIRSRLSTP
jgi:glutathione synthase/RimK-type ligase-like ATP-grasp enzyme